MAAVISACVYKNLNEVGEFLCSHLIMKLEDDMHHFWHILLYYFRKGKNKTKTQNKICAVYGEGAVTD